MLIKFQTFLISGILSEIDYIEDLGVDTVWLSSLYQNGKDTVGMQNYEWDDIIDHMSVGKTVGTEEDLLELLSAFEEIGKYLLFQLSN